MMKAGGTEIGKTLAEKSRGLFSANDWQCKTCSNVNWARRSECNMCNTPKYTKLEERTGAIQEEGRRWAKSWAEGGGLGKT